MSESVSASSSIIYFLMLSTKSPDILYVFSILRTCSWYEMTVKTSKEAIRCRVSFRTSLRRKFVLLLRTYLLNLLHESSIGFNMQCFIGKLLEMTFIQEILGK